MRINYLLFMAILLCLYSCKTMAKKSILNKQVDSYLMVDSITVCGNMCYFQSPCLTLLNDSIVIFRGKKQYDNIHLDNLSKQKLFEYIDVFFVSQKKPYCYKAVEERKYKNLYIDTDSGHLEVTVYGSGKILKQFYLLVAQSFLRNEGSEIIVMYGAMSYYYDKDFIDFYNLLINILKCDKDLQIKY